MLNLKYLVDAGAETTAKTGSRAEFRRAYSEAQKFNASYKKCDKYNEAEEKAQVQRLDLILELAGTWLTAKPLKQADASTSPVKAEKNAARWEALANLCEQCSTELIDMGFRPLYGHWNGNPLASQGDHANYWLERLDPKHRGASSLKGLYAKWAQLPASDPGHGKGFFEYADSDANAKSLKGVRYDKDSEASQADVRRKNRREWQVQIQGGKLHSTDPQGDAAGAYSTDGKKTAFAGNGFAIFVWDHKRRIFSGDHVVNGLHHSTPRGGRPVRCAGEFRTDPAGNIVMITSKTGHYTTTETEFKTFIKYLIDQHAITDKTLCVPDTSGQTNGTWKTYRVVDWVAGNLKVVSRDDLAKDVPSLNKDNLNCRNFWLRLAV